MVLQKGSVTMRKIIGIDVSKSTAKLSVAIDAKTVYEGDITLDMIGFTSLKAIIDSYGGAEVVFEATGVYSRRLERYLLDESITYHILNPLVAKKRLDDGSRTRKNDVRDARGLAITEFAKHPKPFKPSFYDPVYRELMDISRYYDQQTEDLKRTKNRIHRLIQLSFPGIEEELDLRKPSALHTLTLFSHPAELTGLSFENIKTQILDMHLKGMGAVRSSNLARALWRSRARSYPAVSGNSFVVQAVKHETQKALKLLSEREETVQAMVSLAERTPEYVILLSIPNIAENTAVRLVAELGDIRRFKTRAKLNSFIGLDLQEIQSGNYTAQRKITKHGNAHTRKLLYWTVINMIGSGAQPSHIRDFYAKRQATASRRKPLLVACMDRLLKTIHYLVNTNQLYSYELACSR